MTEYSDNDEFVHMLQREAESYNAPPTPPREAMWDAIQISRAARRRARHRRVTWMAGSAAAVLLLALGVSVGRVTALRESNTRANVTATAQPSPTVYRAAANAHLVQIETLLALFETDAETGIDEDISAWAGDLLTTTRLLLDSPAAAEPALKELFLDLELVLAQLAQYAAEDGSGAELDLITETLADRALLPRLRTALPVGRPAGA